MFLRGVLLSFAFCGTLWAQSEINLEALSARAQIKWENVPRKVLTFYYPWYGTPDFGGKWVHWSQVQPDKREIASSTHWPQGGPYDSHDPQAVARHMALCKAAGITGVIASWWGQKSFSDRAMPVILEQAQQAGLEVTVYYERVPGPVGVESAKADLLYILNTYGAHPAFMKVGGKPVVFIYGRAMGQMGLPAWATTLYLVNQEYQPGGCFIADRLSRSVARFFDGLHTYNIAGALRGVSPEAAQAKMGPAFAAGVEAADSRQRISCVTIIPGYDDTKIRKPGLKVERHDGELYRVLWEQALAADPHWVLITSFNEWHEGSEIEPSAEYGDQYIKLTAGYAKRFLARPREARPAPTAAAVPEDAQQALQDKLRRITIGVLPQPRSEAVLWLLGQGARLKMLTAEQTVTPGELTPQNYAALLYAADESYAQTVRRKGDVDAAILKYLQAGGLLVVMPSLPYPFYRDSVSGEVVQTAAKLGVPIGGSGPVEDVKAGEAQGWEQPPADRKFSFVCDTKNLPHCPAKIAFPAAGDRRWRPFRGRDLPAGDMYVPLIQLQDDNGGWYGDGAAYVEHRESSPQGGKVLYLWFRLQTVPEGEALLHDLWAFALAKL